MAAVEERPSQLSYASSNGRPPAHSVDRVRTDGKFFSLRGARFDFRGVTYGTFDARTDGASYPERARLRQDLEAIHDAGFGVVRTYTVPPDDLLEIAAELGLRILADVFYPDWRYVVGGSRREIRRVVRAASEEVRQAARRLAGNPHVLALSLGNEVPADVVRWHGLKVVAGGIRELAEVVREEDPDQLVTYANYPTAEYLPLESLDFLMFNVFLEEKRAFRRYLTRLHHLAGDRPLVLGEMGLSAAPDLEGEHEQADVLDWQLETAIERGIAGTCVYSWTDEWWVAGVRVEGWRFGLTRADRSPRPALDVARRWNGRDVRDLDVTWPSVSVVVCAHNAAETLDECLQATLALDYPDLELIVVDDGSCDATAEIARRYAGVELIQIPRGGLAAARNAGFEAAGGELVAYLDSDAYPAPEWPYYLALGLDARDVGGVGGPNIPPRDDPTAAHVVARSPGGPVHVLVSDDRAEHVPGCNMAFWKIVLTEVGGFDPAYTAAGDDIDVCWKVLDGNWEIGFHPAAVVWHHRRGGLRPYLRQQHTYGKSEALVEARHPSRFTPTGTARWHGRIYNSVTPSFAPQRIYRGPYGTAAYQSVYHAGGHMLDLWHQVGVPVSALMLLTAPLAAVALWLAVPALVALFTLAALAGVDMARVHPPRGKGLRFRMNVALHTLLQPLVRAWGRTRHRSIASRDLRAGRELPVAVRTAGRGVVVVPDDRPRFELAAAIVEKLRRRGIRAIHPSGWEDYDARLLLSMFVYGDLQTSSHPEGFVQVRVRARPRVQPLLVALFVVGAAAAASPLLAPLALVPLAQVAQGGLRARRLPASVFPTEDQPGIHRTTSSAALPISTSAPSTSSGESGGS